jgi:hypothetical protein
MSHSVNLHRLSRAEFEKLSSNKETYKFNFSDETSSVFDQNFEGLRFLFLTYYQNHLPAVLEKIFSPEEYIGEEIDYNDFDFSSLNDILTATPLYFISPNSAAEADEELRRVDNLKLLRGFDAAHFNANDVYPKIWHHNETEDEAFNRRHLEEGLDLLRQTISTARETDSYIIYFTN